MFMPLPLLFSHVPYGAASELSVTLITVYMSANLQSDLTVNPSTNLTSTFDRLLDMFV